MEELNIVLEAEIPVSMVPDETPVHPGGPSPSVGLHLLDLPLLRRLPRLVFHHLREEDESKEVLWKAAQTEDKRTVGQLVMLLRPPEHSNYGTPIMYQAYDNQGAVIFHTLSQTPAEHASRIVSIFWRTLKFQMNAARQDHLNRVLRSLRPIHVRMPVDCLHSISRGVEGGGGQIAHPDLIEFCGADEIGIPTADTFEAVGNIWSDGARCRVLGYPEHDLKMMKEDLIEYQRSGEAADWSSTWSWTHADGSEFTIDFAAAKKEE